MEYGNIKGISRPVSRIFFGTAVGPMLAQFPFKVRKVHPDGGGEFVNEAVLSLFAARFGVQPFEQLGQPFTRFGVFSI